MSSLPAGTRKGPRPHGRPCRPNILSHTLPVGSIVGPNKLLGGWGYPTVNPILKKYKTGAEELIAFTEKEIKR